MHFLRGYSQWSISNEFHRFHTFLLPLFDPNRLTCLLVTPGKRAQLRSIRKDFFYNFENFLFFRNEKFSLKIFLNLNSFFCTDQLLNFGRISHQQKSVSFTTKCFSRLSPRVRGAPLFTTKLIKPWDQFEIFLFREFQLIKLYDAGNIIKVLVRNVN